MKKQVEKILTIITMILIILASCVGTVNAAEEGSNQSIDVKLTTTTAEVEKGKEVTVSVTLANINVERGVNTFKGTITYDSKILEYVSVQSSNGWGAFFNAGQGILVCNSMELIKKDQVIAKLVFRVKEDATEGNTTINASEMETSEGNVKIIPADTSLTFKVKAVVTSNPDDNQGGDNQGGDNQGGDNQGGNNQGGDNNDGQGGNTGNDGNQGQNGNSGNNGSSNQGQSGSSGTTGGSQSSTSGSQKQVNNVATSKIPHTGVEDIAIYLVIVAVVIIGIISYMKYRKYRGV